MKTKDPEVAIMLALEALLKGKRDNGAKAAREALADALEATGYRWPRSDDGRF